MMCSSETAIRARRDAGFAQLAVLGSLTILAALMTAAVATAMSGNKAASALEAAISNEAAARAGIARLVSAISNPSDTLEVKAFESAVTLDLSGTVVHLRIESEASKLSLLLSDIALLLRYARNAGTTTDDTEQLRQTLMKSRTERDGAAGLQAMIETLRGLRSRGELLQDLTIYGTMSGIDPAYATANALAVIPDLSPAQIVPLLQTPPGDRAMRFQSRYFAGSGRRFSLLTTVAEPTGNEYQRRIVIELSSTGVPMALSGLF